LSFSSLEARKIKNMAKKSRIWARRAHFFDFQADFRGNFHFLRHRADISSTFSLSPLPLIFHRNFSIFSGR
jgi:hypothetical protein